MAESSSNPQIHEEAAKMKNTYKKLTIEDYLKLYDSSLLPEALTNNQLKQLVGMHGFVRRLPNGKQFPKKTLVEAVKGMELMDLCRSTMRGSKGGVVSGFDASVTVEEVIRDFKNIGWDEGPVTSLITQGTVIDSSSSTATTSDAVPLKRKRPTIAKKKSSTQVIPNCSAISPAQATVKPKTRKKKLSTGNSSDPPCVSTAKAPARVVLYNF